MNHIAIINKRPYNYTGRKWLDSFQRTNECKPSCLSVLIILVEFLRFYLCYALDFLWFLLLFETLSFFPSQAVSALSEIRLCRL